MFEGTVRNNMDPLEEYTDDQIWEVGWYKRLNLQSFFTICIGFIHSLTFFLNRPWINVNLEMKLERKKESLIPKVSL